MWEFAGKAAALHVVVDSAWEFAGQTALPALLVFAGQHWQHWRLAGKAAAPPILPGF